MKYICLIQTLQVNIAADYFDMKYTDNNFFCQGNLGPGLLRNFHVKTHVS